MVILTCLFLSIWLINTFKVISNQAKTVEHGGMYQIFLWYKLMYILEASSLANTFYVNTILEFHILINKIFKYSI